MPQVEKIIKQVISALPDKQLRQFTNYFEEWLTQPLGPTVRPPAETISPSPESSDPELVEGMHTLAETIRQTFSDNSRIVYPKPGQTPTNLPSLENIIAEFSLEGGLTWKFKEGKTKEFEGVDSQGKVVINGSYDKLTREGTIPTEDINIQMFKNQFDPTKMRILRFTEFKSRGPQLKQGAREASLFYLPPTQDYQTVENTRKELNYLAIGEDFSRIQYSDYQSHPINPL